MTEQSQNPEHQNLGAQDSEPQDLQMNRSQRNRKRSKRRAIFCPIHSCYMDSLSRKYSLYAETAEQLQKRGVARRTALLLMSTQTTVPLTGEWLEAFWCPDCQQTDWYHVKRSEDGSYEVIPAPTELWQQVQGVIHPQGNPSVGEFTRKAARMGYYPSLKQGRFF
jgi:hypothetical protein